MKTVFALTLFLFIFAASVAAQPGYYFGFSPYDLCKYTEGKIIFVGRVISTEPVSNSPLQKEVLNDPSEASLKTTVSVEKVFGGRLRLHERRQVYIKLWRFPKIDPGDEHIFVAGEVTLNGAKVLAADDSSTRLSPYTAEIKALIFSRIEARLRRYPQSPPLSGIVLQTDAAPDYSPEREYLYGYQVRNFQPVARITVIAESKQNGKVYRTKTDEKGTYTFKNLKDGDYNLSIILPKSLEQERADDNYVVRIVKNDCRPDTVFTVRKSKNP